MTLSEEFLRLCKNHLKPHGVIYYNTTGSEDDSFVAASDSPFVMTPKEKRNNLLKFQNSGKPVFAKNNPTHSEITWKNLIKKSLK